MFRAGQKKLPLLALSAAALPFQPIMVVGANLLELEVAYAKAASKTGLPELEKREVNRKRLQHTATLLGELLIQLLSGLNLANKITLW